MRPTTPRLPAAKIILTRLALIALVASSTAPAMLPAVSWAQAAAPAAAEQTGPASKMIQDLGNRAISIAADKSLSDAARQTKYDQLLRSSFDVPTIGHFVLGRYWAGISPDKQQEFLKMFEELIVKIYSARINFYSGEGFQVTGERPESDADTIVNSQITHPDGSKPTTVDWRVRSNAGKLLIVDVSVEGVSQSVTQRQEYASILQQNNGNIDPLLDRMKQQLNTGGNAAGQ